MLHNLGCMQRSPGRVEDFCTRSYPAPEKFLPALVDFEAGLTTWSFLQQSCENLAAFGRSRRKYFVLSFVPFVSISENLADVSPPVNVVSSVMKTFQISPHTLTQARFPFWQWKLRSLRKNVYLFVERCRKSNNVWLRALISARLYIFVPILWILQSHFPLWLSSRTLQFCLMDGVSCHNAFVLCLASTCLGIEILLCNSLVGLLVSHVSD